MSVRSIAIVISVGAFALLGGSVATAAQVKVLSSIGLKEVLTVLGPQFEKASGHTLSISYDVASALKTQIVQGEKFDVAILTNVVADDLIKQDKLLSNTRVDLARSGLGLAIREGAKKPDLSTVEAFKAAILSARSIATSKGGLSTTVFAELLDRLGIAEQIKPKLIVVTQGYVAEVVARGEAELGVHLISEILPVKGASLAGPFPADIQKFVVITGGVSREATQMEAAKELLRFLSAPAALPTLKAKGMQQG